MLSVSGLFLVSNLLSNLLYGAFVSVVVDCVRIIIQKYRSTGNVHKVLLVTLILITILATTKMFIDNVVTVRAFVFLTPDGQAQYPSLDSPMIITLNILWILQTFIADSFIVYRTWIIWRRNYRIAVLPTLLTLAGLGVGIHYTLLHYGPKADLEAYLTRRFYTIMAFLAMTLALNIICTALIAYRVRSVRWEMHSVSMSAGSSVTRIGSGKDSVNNALVIIVESALVYTILLTVDLSFFAAHSPLTFLITPLISQVIALVFGTIIVRSAKGVAVEDTVPTMVDSDVSHTGPKLSSSSCVNNSIHVMLGHPIASRAEINDFWVDNPDKAK